MPDGVLPISYMLASKPPPIRQQNNKAAYEYSISMIQRKSVRTHKATTCGRLRSKTMQVGLLFPELWQFELRQFSWLRPGVPARVRTCEVAVVL